ncbi:hypothetical protein [Nonomuraea sp. NPDC001023]|uniref:hypothetical protein n=1 Tax=unclassified Nonomuraea TaxID=2593643 RepID=UPI003319E908
MTYLPGEIVRVTLTGKIVEVIDGDNVNWDVGDEPEIRFSVEGQAGTAGMVIPLTLPDAITIERVIPADGEPQPGDLWTDSKGEPWFCAAHLPEPDDREDMKGCNSEGWRTVLVPVNVGPYGSSPQRPEEVNQQYGPLILVYRPARVAASADEAVA